MNKKSYTAPEIKEVKIDFSLTVLVASPPPGGTEGIGDGFWD